MRALTRAGWARDRLKSLLTGKPAADDELREAVEDRVEAVVRAAAERGAERTARAWRDRAAGQALDGTTGLDRASASSRPPPRRRCGPGRASSSISSERKAARSARPRGLARSASTGRGLTVMLAVFAQTGGLTGAEVVVAGGTSAVAQKVLEAIFGDQAVRTLAAQARGDLFARVERLCARTLRASTCSSTRRCRGGELRPAPRGGGRDPPGRMKSNLDQRLAALGEAAGLAEGRLDGDAVVRARAVVAQAGERLGLGLESTVVALAGPTGAGKSRLFNALAGEELADVGRRRPTTSAGQAASGGTAPIRYSTGSRSRAATGWRRQTASPGRPSRPPRLRLGRDRAPASRSTASSGSPTSSPGWSSRRSTPMRRSTTATCVHSPRTRRRWRSS